MSTATYYTLSIGCGVCIGTVIVWLGHVDDLFVTAAIGAASTMVAMLTLDRWRRP